MGGCLPILLQMPILRCIAFPKLIELRQERSMGKMTYVADLFSYLLIFLYMGITAVYLLC